MEKINYQTWTISDEFWDVIKGSIPDRQRDPNRTYKCAPGRGRKPLDKRKVMEGIFYVLRTGCLWKAAPKEFGAASSIHKYFQEWLAEGVFDKIWKKGLLKYDELEGIAWEWQRLNGCMIKVPLALEAIVKNLTDRRKKRNKIPPALAEATEKHSLHR